MSAHAAPIPRPARPRLRRRWLLIAGGVGLAVIAGLAIVGAVVGGPGKAKGDCSARKACPGPPPEPLLVVDTPWRSTELGFHLEYPSPFWNLGESDGRSVRLDYKDADATLTIEGAPANERTPKALFDERLGKLRDRGFALSEDTEPAHLLFGPELAFHDGVGGIYSATVDSPQGTSSPVSVAMLAAGDRQVSLAATVVMSGVDEQTRKSILGDADTVLDTLRLASGPA